ncbi:MAG TPA: phospholipase D-like domain-containing protein [Woeseiaceae bacterium]|nr:phospholipase D-like domain-containing protein [Woeseiaceae bacterium]
MTCLFGTGLLVPLNGCVTTPPDSHESPTPAAPVADADGPMPDDEAEQLLASIAARAPDPQEFAELFDTVGALSDSPIYSDSRAELLIDGPVTYEAMLKEIGEATSSILLETYIFADDGVGRKFAAALGVKAREGVAVRVIFDSIGSILSDDEFFAGMRADGIQIVEYHDINPADGGNPLNANVRDHRKLLIVDGRVAFTGGINLSDTYSSSSLGVEPEKPLEGGWRDTHVAVYGPAVAGFLDVFADNWIEHTDGTPLPEVVVDPGDAGSDVVAVLKSDGGDARESEIFHAYREAMEVARERVWITQAYFAPDDGFMDDLKAAAGRGVDVRVVVPGASNSALVLNASRSRYGDLLEAGVRIYETHQSFVHAKTAVIDGLWSTVGSSNLDYRSFLHNDEVNAVVFGADFARQLEMQFVDDILRSRAVTLEEWRDRGVLRRFSEWLSWPLEYWL